jgi:hypothetical protein
MYTVLIILHSWLRWAVVLVGLVAVFSAISGRSSGRAWGPQDDTAGRFYTVFFDVQVIIGLLLYLFASPIITMARQHMAESMANDVTRFWLIEHPFGMIVALALAHVGRVRVRRAVTDRSRFGRAAVFYGLSLLIALLATPWPGLAHGRSLFRLW